MKVYQDRAYQDRLIGEVRVALRECRAVLLQCPPGGGKTAMAAKMLRRTHERGADAFFIAHRDFLLDQTSQTFESYGVPHSFIAAGFHYNPYMKIQICGVASLVRRLEKLTPPKLLIWDECKHMAAATYRQIFEWAPNSKHVGLDGTPERLDGKGLDFAFDKMVYGPSVSWLIENGFLSEYRAYAPSTPNLAKVHTVAGDYNKAELGEVMDDGQIVGNMVGHHRQLALGKRSVYFAVSIAHSKHIAAAFTANGIPFIHLDGDSTTAERLAGARALASGEIQGISNVDLFGEGYDLSSQVGFDVTIDCVGLARPTKSKPLYLQQGMRALRAGEGKDYGVILDYAGNIKRHDGLPDTDWHWSLEGRAKKAGGGGGPAVKQCPECLAMHPGHLQRCPYCNYEHPRLDLGGRDVEEIDADLKEVDVKALRAQRTREEYACKTIGDLIELGKRRGYGSPEKWAGFKWTSRERAAQARVESQAAQFRFRNL